MQPTVAWLGLDAHAQFPMLAWMDDQGNRRQHWRLPTSGPQLIRHLKLVSAATKHPALEACGLGRWLARVAAPRVTDALVCGPRENHRISRHHHKCDEEDSYGPAHLHRLGALQKVWQSPGDGRAVFKRATQAYLDAVQRQTALKLQLKAISYRARLVAVKQKRGAVHEFHTASLARTGDEVHARLNTQRKILHTLLVLWQSQREFDAERFPGTQAQPTAKATCGWRRAERRRAKEGRQRCAEPGGRERPKRSAWTRGARESP
jgi:hypothetical protein